LRAFSLTQGLHFNITFSFLLAEFFVHSDIKNVAHNNGLTSEEVESMVMFSSKFMLPIDVSNFRRLGIDEISLVKGHGQQ
jgi:hypothetical protein